MRHNAFDNEQTDNGVLQHSEREALFADARATTLRSAMIQHGVTNIEALFPDPKAITNEPIVFKPTDDTAAGIVDGVVKTPFSRIKTLVADLSEDEARARGYIKGNEKIEQVFKILSRVTTPQTVYKKQKLDRDDIIDIESFDIVPFIWKEMRAMLKEEIGRAILVGDGRAANSKDKIKEENIRPVFTDDDFYTIKETFADEASFLETLVLALTDMQGSGTPTLYIEPKLYARIKLLKGTDGRFLYGSDVPSDTSMADRFGVAKIVPTKLLPENTAVAFNLSDYRLGSSKGGEITTFDDFDIDFNAYKYLIETRISGALALPKSALSLTKAAAPTPTK